MRHQAQKHFPKAFAPASSVNSILKHPLPQNIESEDEINRASPPHPEVPASATETQVSSDFIQSAAIGLDEAIAPAPPVHSISEPALPEEAENISSSHAPASATETQLSSDFIQSAANGLGEASPPVSSDNSLREHADDLNGTGQSKQGGNVSSPRARSPAPPIAQPQPRRGNISPVSGGGQIFSSDFIQSAANGLGEASPPESSDNSLQEHADNLNGTGQSKQGGNVSPPRARTPPPIAQPQPRRGNIPPDGGQFGLSGRQFEGYSSSTESGSYRQSSQRQERSSRREEAHESFGRTSRAMQ
ncbi:hypothetical protein FB451DRAFT_443298 [Mycena latifolia]|nr:hypothetical protein FB451DRAFT_443298 [Mycena latifolia]